MEPDCPFPLHCYRWAAENNQVTRYTSNMRLLTGVPLLLSLSFAACVEFIGKPVGGSDGDSITVLHDRAQLKIRPAAIDSPDKDQAFGKILKRELRDNFVLPPPL
jgi:hypothetical protein